MADKACIMEIDPTVDLLLVPLSQVLIAQHQTIGTAESCSGGILATLFTYLPGSSRFYRGGLTCYHNDLKISMLGVSSEVIEEEGAVSAEVARAMAEGCRQRLGVDFGLAITGIAGPDGGAAAKPVGIVFCSVAGPNVTLVECKQFPGNRHEIRVAACLSILAMLRSSLEQGS